jgi:hypothetical protein
MTQPLYISAAGRAYLADLIRVEYGLEMSPDRLDPALRQPSPPLSEIAEWVNRLEKDGYPPVTLRNLLESALEKSS